MKAAIRSKYGPPGVLSIKELETPTPKDNEVLIRVYATTVNRTDCHILTGKPYIMRLFTGLFKPRSAITGSVFAGQIEALGKNVNSFKVGDRVMGFGGVFGVRSHAQFKTFPEARGIITMPANLAYDEAAACIEGAVYAAMSIGRLKPNAGQKALVRGATGAIGSSWVQLLKFYGVYVTAVCGAEHSELVKSLGADRVIDYKTQDFKKDSERYDYFFDTVGKIAFFQCKPLLKEKGMFFPANGMVNMFLAIYTSIVGGKKVMFPAPIGIRSTLNFIKDLVEKGKFKPLIDRKYPIEKIGEAYTYVASGQKIGNVIINMDA